MVMEPALAGGAVGSAHGKPVTPYGDGGDSLQVQLQVYMKYIPRAKYVIMLNS